MDIVESLLRVALLGSSWVLWLLLALSVVSFAAMAERWVFFRRNRAGGEALRRSLSKALHEDDEDALSKALISNPSVEADVLRAALEWRRGGPEAFSDAVESEIGRARAQLERSMTLLGTLGNNAPFIGLFGTVLGVIEAFHHLSDGSGEAAMGNVMSGIAEALVATGVGIFVAIPAVVAYNVAQKKIADVENDVQALAKLVSAWLRAGGEPHARRAPARVREDVRGELALAEAE
ncbi:MotA/TolQ/ExbB proton channel family protein [Sandaracinus amylolyticus]|uniref:MotA/TolQ/ExbB proton channel family protein n=1 Tax=Sandaracinus amylolyticus TaxID=927083 RepID=A0A0F6YH95_9BACT|nr:MotA/TolQ/ExbB proton channel family protein [Sandaracinus amylolyticus]AKF05641.1 MotA/TolQ/ExbB proton channel family protein [Sandaracinus amylolyticus]